MCVEWWIFFSSALNFRPKEGVLSFLPFSFSLLKGSAFGNLRKGSLAWYDFTHSHPNSCRKIQVNTCVLFMLFFLLTLENRGWWGYLTSTCIVPHGNFFLTWAISFWTDRSASLACLLTHSKVHVTATTDSLQFFPIYFTLSVCDTLFRWLTVWRHSQPHMVEPIYWQDRSPHINWEAWSPWDSLQNLSLSDMLTLVTCLITHHREHIL